MVRIISLIPSATEMVAALGFRDQLVGRSHECDQPAEVKALPSCTTPKFEPDGTSYQIDARIKAILQEGVSIYRVDATQLDELAPDVIITQSQCDVCAVSLAEVQAAACAMIRSKPAIVSLSPNSLQDIYADIGKVAQALGVPEKGKALAEQMQDHMAAIASKARTLPNKPSAALIEWIDPLMAAGNWMPDLVEMAGGSNLFGASGVHSPWLDWDALVASDPDLFLIIPCGFGIPKTREELGPLLQHPQWPQLRAVQQNRVYLADGNQYFNRPGPRLTTSLEILAEIFHPDHFKYGHAGRGFELL